ncbi:MAG: FAD-binding oxidoreductase [Frankia sp.]
MPLAPGRPGAVDRRLFLRGAAAAGLAASAAACSSSASASGRPRPTGSSAAPAATATRASASPSATPADWSELGRQLGGRLVRPGDAAYPQALQLFDPRFDAIRPAGIAYAGSAADVAAGLRFSASTGVPLAVRSGGHSYAGYSSGPGLVLDVTRLATVTPRAGGTATVGAGARLVDVYSTLAAAGVSIPAGSCPTVGIAGLALGGGQGVVGRKYGLTSDRMIGAEVVLASGETVRVDENHDADLFWALRGGGGGNFGVVTSFTFATHPTRSLALFSYRWDWSHASEVLGAWLGWAPFAPDELWSNCVLSAAGGTTPRISVSGVYVGSSDAAAPVVRRLLGGVGAAPVSSFLADRGYLPAMLIEAGCAGMTVPACHLPTQNPAGTLSRVAQLAASDYVNAPLSTAGRAAVTAGIERRSATPGAGGGAIAFDSYGGAINRVSPSSTAFVHRGALACIQYTAGYSTSASATSKKTNAAWLADFHTSMRPYVDGYAYQNYIDANLPDWQHAYYGANADRLKRVKREYDPRGLFHFAQAIAG